jgi:hypothetical protein
MLLEVACKPILCKVPCKKTTLQKKKISAKKLLCKQPILRTHALDCKKNTVQKKQELCKASTLQTIAHALALARSHTHTLTHWQPVCQLLYVYEVRLLRPARAHTRIAVVGRGAKPYDQLEALGVIY